MCTVTFIPVGDRYYLSSNRDEHHTRRKAGYPHKYRFDNTDILFPKDPDAGGTWIAARNNGDTAVLLNGAFKKHIPKPPYRKSRGLVLLALIEAINPVIYFSEIDLEHIEPFTVIFFIQGELYECRWDGRNKYKIALPVTCPHIWSSATLYSEKTVAIRERWFNEWISQHSFPTQKEVIDFHRFTGDGDAGNDLTMNRDGKILTVSITSVELSPSGARMCYLDLADNKTVEEYLTINEKSNQQIASYV